MRNVPVVLIGIVLACSSALTHSAYPELNFSVCKGEQQSNCSATYWIRCNENEDDKARQVCAVNENGTVRVRQYVKQQGEQSDGDDCGYKTWSYKCLSQ